MQSLSYSILFLSSFMIEHIAKLEAKSLGSFGVCGMKILLALLLNVGILVELVGAE